MRIRSRGEGRGASGGMGGERRPRSPWGGGRVAVALVWERVTPVLTGVSEAGEAMVGAGVSGEAVRAFCMVVVRVGSGSKSRTCSLKWVQRVVTPVVAQVLMVSRVRCPSFSVQRRRCGCPDDVPRNPKSGE